MDGIPGLGEKSAPNSATSSHAWCDHFEGRLREARTEKWGMPSDQPRKHHYLPQFYLKGFAAKDGRLTQCVRQEAKLFLTNVAKTAAERDYHRFDVTNVQTDEFGAEKVIAQVESHQAKILEAVLKDPASFAEHRVELLGLTQFMLYRVPKIRDMLANTTEAALVAATKVMEKNSAFDDMPENLKRHLNGRSLVEAFRIKPKNWYLVLQMLRLSTDRKLYELLYRRKLTVLIAKGFRRFITGDAAVAVYDRKHGRTPWKAAGFASATAEFSFPLSSDAYCSSATRRPQDCSRSAMSKSTSSTVARSSGLIAIYSRSASMASRCATWLCWTAVEPVSHRRTSKYTTVSIPSVK